MPGCRSTIRSSTLRSPREPAPLSRYVRLRTAPPRAANDNGRFQGPRLWQWALALGVAPTVGLALILSLMI